MIPTFDDFLADVGDKKSEWFSEMNGKMGVIFPINEFNINDFVETIIILSHSAASAMLRDYHEWLTEQLQQSSVHLIR